MTNLGLTCYNLCTVKIACLVSLIKSESILKKLQKLSLINIKPHIFTTFKNQKNFNVLIFSQFLSLNSHFELVLASTEVPFGYKMGLEGIKRLETYDHLGFSAGTHFISDKRCYSNTKRMIDYFADFLGFITLN